MRKPWPPWFSETALPLEQMVESCEMIELIVVEALDQVASWITTFFDLGDEALVNDERF